MNKFILSTICLCLCLCLFACTGGKESKDTDNIGDTTDKIPETEALPNRVVTAIYGTFDEQYDFIYEDICKIPDTFTEEAPIYALIDDHNASYNEKDPKSMSLRTPIIFYLAEKLDINSEQLKQYYTACLEKGITDIMPSDEAINAIVSGDASAAMKVCAHPSALYKDGKVYTLRMLLSGTGEGVTDDEIKSTFLSAEKYYSTSLLKSDRLNDVMKDKLAQLGFEIAKENSGTLCTVHSDEYHTIPAALAEIVTTAELEAWKNSCPDEDGCGIGYNIVSFVEKFAVTKENFIDVYNAAAGTLGNYNINVIYGGDADTYYKEKHTELYADIEADRAMAAIKAKAVELLGMTDFVTNVNEFSLAEILLMASKNDEVIAALSEYASTLVASPEFDFNEIYGNSDNLLRLMRGHSAYYVDRYVCKRATFETPYEAHSLLN